MIKTTLHSSHYTREWHCRRLPMQQTSPWKPSSLRRDGGVYPLPSILLIYARQLRSKYLEGKYPVKYPDSTNLINHKTSGRRYRSQAFLGMPFRLRNDSGRFGYLWNSRYYCSSYGIRSSSDSLEWASVFTG